MGVTGLEGDRKTPRKQGKTAVLGPTGGRSGDCSCPVVEEIARLAASQPPESREFILALVRQVVIAQADRPQFSTAAPIPTKQATAPSRPPSASPTEQEAIA